MTSGTILDSEDFDFTGIFPTCTNGFSWISHHHNRNQESHKFTTLCSDFYKDEGLENRSSDFSILCRVLGLYLKHIESKGYGINLKSCCELFYYKLEKELMHSFKLKCTDSLQCYEKMTKKKSIRNFPTTISNICMKYYENVEEDTYKLLEHLFKIYYYIDLFKNRSQCTTTEMRKFQQKIIDLENYSCNNKSRLKAELEKIINVCEGYIIGWKDHHTAKHAAYLLTEKNWIGLRKMKLTELGDEILKKKRKKDVKTTEIMEQETIHSQLLMDNVTDDVTNTGLSNGTAFIGFSILIITFILYKYSTYFSFLKPSVRKLRRKFNKNNKNNLDFLNSFDVEYKNINDNIYKISYS
ncbi:variable surface protein [Plasmodium gonderi]|uniref:Variable surface protein n=1 Tax=Plasmodium gonderi TaxID=77519 RepID=A0A1Y1JUU0_PLAGO|nr:variable surface protein [Plasmodium gonderi]GAW84512.1 variable surface protein [Plasmodium gonderi]